MQRYNRQRNRIRNDLKYDDAPDSVLGSEYARAKKIGVDYPYTNYAISKW